VPGTPYAVGSATKPFTATAIVHGNGAISIDRPVNEYLGSARLAARVGTVEEATVRRVLSHTAGLPTHYRFFFEDEKPRPPAIENSIRCCGVLMKRPGEMHLYSNMGYGILGHLIGQVSHVQPFRKLTSRRRRGGYR
jgi:CubicO group peptidase (beta-lactamase class C family)